MSGRHDTILNLCCQAIAEEHRDSMPSLLTCLLNHQLVWDSQSNQYYKVASGMGMGARHSGSVSDLVFYLLAEKDLLERGVVLLSVGGGGVAYIRFRDDILAIFESPRHCKSFLETLSNNA